MLSVYANTFDERLLNPHDWYQLFHVSTIDAGTYDEQFAMSDANMYLFDFLLGTVHSGLICIVDVIEFPKSNVVTGVSGQLGSKSGYDMSGAVTNVDAFNVLHFGSLMVFSFSHFMNTL